MATLVLGVSALVAAWKLLPPPGGHRLAALLPDWATRLVEVERARRSLSALAFAFRDDAGAGAERALLERVRRTCAGRGVVHLDDVEAERLRAGTEAPAAGGNDDAGVLLDLDFVRDGTSAVVAAERKRRLPAGTHVLALGSGQVHTRATLALARSDIGTIEIEARTSEPAFLLVGWSDRADVALMHRDKVRVDLRADGRFHLYSIDAGKALARGLADGATLRRLFLGARSEAGGEVEVARLRLLSKSRRYAGATSGVDYEEVGGQLRRSLWQRTPSSLAYGMTLPNVPAVLETGVALARDEQPVEVDITLEETTGSVTLLRRLVLPDLWQDLRLDLGPWAGRTVSLRLSARGTSSAVVLWSSPTVRPATDHSGAPPILLVLEDALRADRLSVYGGPVAAPAHERLAATGTVFERVFAQAQQTRSSVPSLMTSLPPSATGAWDFSDSLRDEYVTLAEMLRTCGYATASFLQNGNAGVYAGLHQGFDVVFDEKNNGVHASDLLAGSVRDWIDAHREQPFFAYVHILDPHGPFDPLRRPTLPDADGGTPVVRDRALDPPWLERPTAEIRRALYDAEVAANDAALGEFWSWLDEGGLLSRAAVVLLADHGEYLGEGGGLWRHHPPSRLEVARVPLLLAAPGLPRGRREWTQAGLIDVAPTLLDLAGVQAPGWRGFGRSLIPLLAGTTQWPDRAVLVEEPGLARGERAPSGCGSVLLGDVQLLLPCVAEADFLAASAKTAKAEQPSAPAEPAQPLRIVGLGADDYGEELAVPRAARALLQWRTRTLLRELQAADIEGWKRTTGGGSAAIRREPRTDERLRALGYLH